MLDGLDAVQQTLIQPSYFSLGLIQKPKQVKYHMSYNSRKVEMFCKMF